MKTPAPCGILGLGMAVPETVRTNDWWPESFITRFNERAKRDITTPTLPENDIPPWQRFQIEEMRKSAGDPFRGAVERRIAAPGEKAASFELSAAKKALADAGVGAADIDFLIVSSLPSDEWTPGDGFFIQHELGIAQGPVLTIDPGCSAFVTGLSLADALLQTGQARRVLLVVSGLMSRITDWNDPSSVAFGDGAAAAVIGPTRTGGGFLAHAAGADGSKYFGVTIGPKGDKPWYEGGGPIYLHSRNVELGRSVVLRTTDFAVRAVDAVLARADMQRRDIQNLYCHQASSWFNAACMRTLGIEKECRTMDTFKRYASVGAANVGVNLWHGREAGQLEPGRTVLLFSFGVGISWASCLLRWGP